MGTGKTRNAKVLMIALALTKWENISRLNINSDNGYINPREREKEIIKQRRRQQFKKH